MKFKKGVKHDPVAISNGMKAANLRRRFMDWVLETPLVKSATAFEMGVKCIHKRFLKMSDDEKAVWIENFVEKFSRGMSFEDIGKQINIVLSKEDERL